MVKIFVFGFHRTTRTTPGSAPATEAKVLGATKLERVACSAQNKRGGGQLRKNITRDSRTEFACIVLSLFSTNFNFSKINFVEKARSVTEFSTINLLHLIKDNFKKRKV